MSSDTTRTLIKKKFCEALLVKYEGMYKEAEGHLTLYMNQAVAIGEHSNLLEECDNFVKAMVDAKDNMNMLRNWMKEDKDTIVIE